jgi:hypothetical protein
MPKKTYMKASRRRDGYIEKPFEKFTDELLSHYLEESRSEAEKMNPILESSPYLFEVDNELSMWKSIYDDLSSFGISHDLSKLYDYKGGLFTLPLYLEIRGCIEDNALMVAVSYALNAALAKAYCLFHGDINRLAKVVDFVYFSGKTTSLATFQREVVAGSSRTGEATKDKMALNAERVEMTRNEAKKLREKNPRISKDEIAEQIFDKVGVSERTARDYLKEITLPR